jgi:hypothetical protein
VVAPVSSTAQEQAAAVIRISGFGPEPAAVTIPAGGQVRWLVEDPEEVRLDVDRRPGVTAVPTIAVPSSFVVRFEASGTYRFYVTRRGTAGSSRRWTEEVRVTVKQPPASPPAVAAPPAPPAPAPPPSVVAPPPPLPAVPPLQVTLVTPLDQARVTQESIAVAGVVTGGQGVSRVVVTLNDAVVSRQEGERTPKNEVPLNLLIKLREGRNILLVTAADAEGNTRQERRVVFYDRPPPAPVPPPAAPPVAVGPGPPPAAIVPPLQVRLATPRDQARVDQERIVLAGVVAGGKGISRVVVTLNGVEVSRLEERTPQRSLPVNLPLKLQEGANTIVVTATEAEGTVQQEIRTVHYEKVAPLAVAVRYPEDQARLTEAASVVAALVTSSKGVATVRVTLNGTEVYQRSERTPQNSVAVTVPVTLREGVNAIVVSASESDGTVRQELRTVFYHRPVAAATPGPAPGHDRWAVVIGVGAYDSPGIPRLRYTVADAQVFAQTLIERAGFRKEQVLLLTDKTERPPTLRNVKWALGDFLARSAKKDDTVVIFFAGHGAPEVDPRGIERDGLAKYLVPSDAEPDSLYASALAMDEIQTIFGRIEAERVVMFLDTCYSGAAGGRTFAAKRTRATNVDDLFLERLTRAKGRAIITASRPAEVSIELPDLGHGIFTYYVVRALQGAADLDRDGVVTLQELYQYVEQEVSRKSRAVGGNQHPVMKGELEGSLPLVTVKGR